ncbi:hypothetical protein N431DRAFT_541791 [Stipitochalara longipes BDJ]|nr:hypothetical protein N431DRAFT_541791 [Stipitochalara longipes BDJ]
MAEYASLDHSNLQGQAIGITFAFPVLATLVVGLRFYSRSLTRTFGADDLVICVAAVLYWAETFVTYMFIKLGYIGYHVWDIPKTYDAQLAGKFGYATELVYVPILGLIKMSILLFLLRLTGQKQAVKKAIWTLLILNGLVTLINIFFIMFQCLPVAAVWDPTAYPNANCIDFGKTTTAFASISVITDTFVLILPTWIVHDLQIPIRQKLMLIGILSFGLITVISGLIRLILLETYSASKPTDFTHTILFTISTIETGLAFMAACAPYMKPLILKIAPRISSMTPYSKTTDQPTPKAYEFSSKSSMGNASRTQTKIQSSVDFTFKAGVEASGQEDGFVGSENEIVMVRETEIRWQGLEPNVKNEASTQSLA